MPSCPVRAAGPTLDDMTTLLHSARRIDARGELDDAWILFDGAVVAAVGAGLATAPDADERIDLDGAVITPGFIDLHGHGGGGHAAEGGPDEIAHAVAAHRRHGTTRSVVSLVANPVARLAESLRGIRELAARDPLVLGSHLEGPFLSPGKPGAHAPEFLIPPTPADIATLLEAADGTLRQITIAPELPGGLDAVRSLAEHTVVAVGHTEADADTARAAFDAGATVLTHAFNAMNGIHHRAPGPVVAAIADPRVTLELVLDGIHVHPDVAGMLFAAAPDRVALITDAMAAAGSADGDYALGSLNVTVRDGVALLSGTQTIAGSTLTQDAALRLAVERVGIDPVDAVAALTSVPARVLGEDRRLGLLAEGYAADAVVLDDGWGVQRVWADGIPLD
jgi:N-acetylglucosamine-6-phosphate deacetylase